MTAKRISGRPILIAALTIVVIAYFATRPMRSRMAAETARIDRENALKSEAIGRLEELHAQEMTARKRVEANPRDAAAHLALASALGQQRRYPEAVHEIKTAQVLEPRNAEPHFALGELSDISGMQDVAIDEYRRALALAPDHARALTRLAYKYVALGWNQDAGRMLVRAVAAQPGDARLHITLGLVHFQNGDFADAERELLTARRLAPTDPTIIGPLAQVYRSGHKLDKALAAYDEAIRATPEKVVLKVERARVLIEMKRYDEAISGANGVLDAFPDTLEARYARALAEKLKGNDAAAIRDFEAIHARQPWMEETLLHLGQLYTRNGRAAEGNRLLTEFNQKRTLGDNLARLTLQVAHRGGDPATHLELGKAYLDGGSYARAIVEFRRTIELSPKDTEAPRLLATALGKNGRAAEAKTILENGGLP